jgi:hypothetical protein
MTVRLSLARPPLASHLDIIKFICKDLFLYVYSKQIDNLRTNHRVGSSPLTAHQADDHRVYSYSNLMHFRRWSPCHPTEVQQQIWKQPKRLVQCRTRGHPDYLKFRGFLDYSPNPECGGIHLSTGHLPLIWYRRARSRSIYSGQNWQLT